MLIMHYRYMLICRQIILPILPMCISMYPNIQVPSIEKEKNSLKIFLKRFIIIDDQGTTKQYKWLFTTYDCLIYMGTNKQTM